MITVLAGGVGAARFLRGLVEVVDPSGVTAIVNTADDFALHGLMICPDLDTVRYTLSDDVGEFGWGRADESWRTMNELRHLATYAPRGSRATDWFRLGDRDLSVHLYRTQRLTEGASLATVTAELDEAAGVEIRTLPMTEDPVATLVTLASGETIDFQEYFVARQHSVAISGVAFAGTEQAKATAGVFDAIENAERVIIAPSNPIVSIDPIFAIDGVAAALRARRDSVIAISPIVGGRTLKGPADRMLVELGHEASATSVARLWSPYAATLVIDTVDSELASNIEGEGMRAVVTSTVMHDIEAASALAQDVMHIALR